MNGLQADYSDRANFIYLDIDDPATATLKEQLDYAVMPHYVLLDGQGAIVEKWTGRIREAELRAAMDDATDG